MMSLHASGSDGFYFERPRLRRICRIIWLETKLSVRSRDVVLEILWEVKLENTPTVGGEIKERWIDEVIVRFSCVLRFWAKNLMVLQWSIIFLNRKICSKPSMGIFIDQEINLIDNLNRFLFEILNIISQRKGKLLKTWVKSVKYTIISKLDIHEIDYLCNWRFNKETLNILIVFESLMYF